VQILYRKHRKYAKYAFDELVKLAKENPDQLEAYRQEQIENLINEAPASV